MININLDTKSLSTSIIGVGYQGIKCRLLCFRLLAVFEHAFYMKQDSLFSLINGLIKCITI
ncbi:hypothetical protein BHC44_08865 [Snodgrassella alvi]|nr:hypothetical protein BHC44_08865 [Snodgrassella alvi]